MTAAIRCLTVYDTPVPKARPRVTVQNGKARGYTPVKTQQAEWRIRTAWIAEHGTEPMTGPLTLTLVVWRTPPTSMSRKRRLTAEPTVRPDLDNFLKTLLDSLNGVAYMDDSQVVCIVARKCYVRDDGPSRWEIALESLA